jgi:hypothetical protein
LPCHALACHRLLEQACGALLDVFSRGQLFEQMTRNAILAVQCAMTHVPVPKCGSTSRLKIRRARCLCKPVPTNARCEQTGQLHVVGRVLAAPSARHSARNADSARRTTRSGSPSAAGRWSRMSEPLQLPSNFVDKTADKITRSAPSSGSWGRRLRRQRSQDDRHRIDHPRIAPRQGGLGALIRRAGYSTRRGLGRISGAASGYCGDTVTAMASKADKLLRCNEWTDGPGAAYRVAKRTPPDCG